MSAKDFEESARTVGAWRTDAVRGNPEKDIPGRQGITYIPLWEGTVFCISDHNEIKYVQEVPTLNTKLIVSGFNSDGLVPAGVCRTIEMVLEIQHKHSIISKPTPKKTKRKSSAKV